MLTELKKISTDDFFAKESFSSPTISWEWKEKNFAKIWGSDWQIEGVVRAKRLAEGKITYPEVTFEGSFKKGPAFLNAFEKGRLFFPNHDFAQIELLESTIQYSNYHDASLKTSCSFTAQDVKKYFGENMVRLLSQDFMYQAEADQNGNLKRGVQIGYCGFSRNTFDFSERRAESLRRLWGYNFQLCDFTPQEASMIKTQAQLGHLLSFNLAGVEGKFLLVLDDISNPTVG